MATSVYAELDTRKRVSLAKIATATSYLITAEPSGRIVLEPAVVMTASEAAIIADPQIRAQYEAAIASDEPLRPRRISRP